MAKGRSDRNANGGWYPQMGRAKGLLQAKEWTRNQQKSLYLVDALEFPKWEGEEVFHPLLLPG